MGQRRSNTRARDSNEGCGSVPPPERRVIDLLDATFPVERSESEWLLTLLSAEELRYIFKGKTDDENPA